MNFARVLVVLAFVFFAGSELRAQAAAPSYGTSSLTSEFVSAWDMQVFDSATTWTVDPSNNFRYTTAAGSLTAGIHVPQGAKIRFLEIDGCDTSAVGDLTVLLAQTGESGIQYPAAYTTGDAATPGCGRFTLDVLPAVEVDADTNNYSVVSLNATIDGSTSIGAIRVYYQLQVSPAPGTATFNDVPTSDPAFQFVEALASSGITAGCGSGNFCPDAPLTRRQMAVFLAKALGLQWLVAPAP